jgi:hypothetical protein
MQLTELRCRSCGAPLAPENVVERLSMARCGHCEAVFALDRLMSPDASTEVIRRARPQLPLPKGMLIEDFGSSLEITRRWFGPVFLFLAFFCVFWNGFMLVWHGMALSTGAWFMSLFGLIHTAVGLGLLYFTVAGFVNRTVIRVQHGVLEVHSGPLPWPGNKTFPSHDVEQFYCQEHVTRSKNGTNTTYEIHAIRRGNTRETLLKGLPEADQALYIEQELERFLRLEDRPIHGELGR